MKWKMAPNSLFAVLLRSPWWISFLIVLLVALASRALLPAQYVPFGIMGGFPFLIIGGIAAYRQLQAPGEDEIAQTMAALARLSWSEFSSLLEQAYRAQGYGVSRVQGDGADLQLVKAGSTTLVCAKRWKAANHGVEAMRSLVQARDNVDASRCSYVVIASLGDNALRFAQKNKVEILTGPALAQLMRKVSPIVPA